MRGILFLLILSFLGVTFEYMILYHGQQLSSKCFFFLRLMIGLRRIRYVNPHINLFKAYATLRLASGEHYLRPCACFRMQRTPRWSRAIATSHGSDGLHALCHPVRLSTSAAVLASDR